MSLDMEQGTQTAHEYNFFFDIDTSSLVVDK